MPTITITPQDEAHRELADLSVRLGHMSAVCSGDLGVPSKDDLRQFEAGLARWRTLAARTGEHTSDELAAFEAAHTATITDLRLGRDAS